MNKAVSIKINGIHIHVKLLYNIKYIYLEKRKIVSYNVTFIIACFTFFYSC